MSKKRIIYLTFTIICMLGIFFASSRNSNESNSTSKGLLKQIITIYEKVTKTNVDKELLIKKFNYPIRKLAHFTLYFILGFLVYNIVAIPNLRKKVIISLIICMIYALFDEAHQLFVSGRDGNFIDVLIDSSGSLLALEIRKNISLFKEKNRRD